MLENFSRNVARLRKLKKLSQQELADMIGVNKQTISNIERGERFVTGENLDRLAEALDANAVQLFGTEEEIAALDVPKIYEQITTYEQKLDMIHSFAKGATIGSEASNIIDHYADQVSKIEGFMSTYTNNKDFANQLDQVSGDIQRITEFFEGKVILNDKGTPVYDGNYQPKRTPSLNSLISREDLEKMSDQIYFIKQNKDLLN